VRPGGADDPVPVPSRLGPALAVPRRAATTSAAVRSSTRANRSRSASTPEALGALTLRAPSGDLVEVRSVARLVSAEGPSQIDRQALKRQITILADLKGYALSQALLDADAATAGLPPASSTTSRDRERSWAEPPASSDGRCSSG